ncbi:MAG: lytic transglycosylase domain-containing protein, partial [Flavobacteriaceae bacterium]|nr:lytic transglycosylase domain-containing protein [Flavobacteriaceae bacterium]
MKKSFFLYFLILSPLLFGQNNYFSNFDDSGNNPIFDQEYSIPLLKNNLTIIDKSGTNNFDNTWVKEPQKIPSNENEFSSLLLMKQLEELNFKTPFNIVHNPTLERFIRSYLQNRKEEISNLMDRAEYYFPMFEEYLDKYDLPLEIKYLAIVESALKPNAVSPSGAKGLWQFMYSTGKEYNLQVSSYVDDRFDPIKSTEAACLYLTKLYQSFNDWDLALAAYNSGPGNVRKAIRRSGGKQNYWEIRQYLS